MQNTTMIALVFAAAVVVGGIALARRFRRGLAIEGAFSSSPRWMTDPSASGDVPYSTEATEEEIFAVGYSAPQCNPGAPSAAIIVPELQSVQDYCFGVPQNTVSIEAARSA